MKSSNPTFLSIAAGYLLFWIIIIFLFAAQMAMAAPQPLPQAIIGSLILWVPWVLVSPLMLMMGYILPPGGVPGWKFALGHLVACSLLIALAVVFSHLLPPPRQPSSLNGPPNSLFDNEAFPESLRPPLSEEEMERRRHDRNPPPEEQFFPTLERTLPVGLPLYISAVLLVGSIKLRTFSQEKERHAIDLEAKLTAAKLTALQLQLQPHFLFNTLNTLTSLVHTDPSKAEEVLLCLCTLLRGTLDTRNRTLIPLRQELDLVRSYLAVQHARYGNRLRVEEDIPRETLSCSVPPLIMLPVVENAIKHALEPCPEGATIFLRSERVADKLVMQIEDSGAGTGKNGTAPSGHGVGMANTRARLHASYPCKNVAFDLIPNHLGGITARFEMPAVAFETRKEPVE